MTPQPISDPTVNSWGNSGMDKPRRRGPLLAIGAAAAVLAGGLGLWAAQRGDATAKPPETGSPAVGNAIEAAKAEPKPQAPAIAPLASAAPLPAAAPALAEPAPSPPVTAPSAAPPVPAPAKPRPAVAVTKPGKAPDAGKPVNASSPPPSTGAVITDFGGRR
jgi:hypothetical protein